MKRLLLLLLLACGTEAPPVPTDRQLWRLEGEWTVRGPARTAPVTILVFRSSHEFVELHCTLIERADGTVYILARSPRVSAVGEWSQRGAVVEATRQKVARSGGSTAATEPLCQPAKLTFRVSGNSVVSETRTYSPVTRLVAPEFETFVNAAKQSPVTCGSESR